jgi:hypothetical protein
VIAALPPVQTVRVVEALDKLTQKGVHAEVDEAFIDMTIVNNYLLAGAVLELLPAPEEFEAVTAVTPQADEEATAPSTNDAADATEASPTPVPERKISPLTKETNLEDDRV